jgi:hydroxypyruvate reductase
MKETLRELFRATIEELSLERVMRERIKVREGVLQIDSDATDLKPFKKIILVALGKAAYPMARAMQEMIDPLVASGVVVSPVPPPAQLRYLLYFQGGHPIPNPTSVHAAEVILEMLSQLKQQHLVIFLLSGGGSAIVEKPIDPSIPFSDLQAFYDLLVNRSGANIVDMNILRKRFSAVKGGRLAEAAHPARQLTLYVSDVPAGQASSIASGPTMPDEYSFEHSQRVVERLGLLDRLPDSYRALFTSGALPETPKPGHPAFRRSSYYALLANEHGLERLESAAWARRWIVERDLSVDDQPVIEAAEHLLRRLRDLKSRHPGRTVAVLTGGELSSPVTGDGRGGRNQAFVLACAQRIAGEKVAVISAGTDGVDGNSPAAGAVADGDTLQRAREAGLDPDAYYRNSDSFGFFDRLDDALVLRPTGNNVRDLRLLVAW